MPIPNVRNIIMPSATRAHARPKVILGETDAERLSALALQMEPSAPFAAGLLLGEIDRAEIQPDAIVPADVVQMHSTVAFIDETHGKRRTVLLVFPNEADIGAGKISVVTPVGAGLIGLTAGDEILWPNRDGQERSLRILRATPPVRLTL